MKLNKLLLLLLVVCKIFLNNFAYTQNNKITFPKEILFNDSLIYKESLDNFVIEHKISFVLKTNQVRSFMCDTTFLLVFHSGFHNDHILVKNRNGKTLISDTLKKVHPPSREFFLKKEFFDDYIQIKFNNFKFKVFNNHAFCFIVIKYDPHFNKIIIIYTNYRYYV
jgi:hypothetical protein